MFDVQTRVVLLLRVTHRDTELPHTLTGTFLMSQTSCDIPLPLGQAVGPALTELHPVNTQETESVWEVWTLKGPLWRQPGQKV